MTAPDTTPPPPAPESEPKRESLSEALSWVKSLGQTARMSLKRAALALDAAIARYEDTRGCDGPDETEVRRIARAVRKARLYLDLAHDDWLVPAIEAEQARRTKPEEQDATGRH